MWSCNLICNQKQYLLFFKLTLLFAALLRDRFEDWYHFLVCLLDTLRS